MSALVTRKDIMKRWGCSQTFINAREADGCLKPLRIGNRTIRYRLEDIEQLEQAKAKAAPRAAKVESPAA